MYNCSAHETATLRYCTRLDCHVGVLHQTRLDCHVEELHQTKVLIRRQVTISLFQVFFLFIYEIEV